MRALPHRCNATCLSGAPSLTLSSCVRSHTHTHTWNVSFSLHQEISHNLGLCYFFIKDLKSVSILSPLPRRTRPLVSFLLRSPLPTKAEEHLNRALQVNKHDRTFMMLGKVQLLAGDTDKAIEVYKRAVEWVHLKTKLGLIIRRYRGSTRRCSGFWSEKKLSFSHLNVCFWSEMCKESPSQRDASRWGFSEEFKTGNSAVSGETGWLNGFPVESPADFQSLQLSLINGRVFRFFFFPPFWSILTTLQRTFSIRSNFTSFPFQSWCWMFNH